MKIDSDEISKYITSYLLKLDRRNKVKQKQLDRLHESDRFVELTKKVIQKYNSKAYKDRWYERHIEPPETLFYFLFDYAEKYGRSCTDEEWRKYGNVFSVNMYFCEGFIFNKMNGQGTVVHVYEIQKK